VSVLAQVALSSVLVSAILAGIAWLVHRGGRYPTLAHGLWVLVLFKVLTPPLVFVPVLPTPSQGASDGGDTLVDVLGTTIDPSPWEAAVGWLTGSGAELLAASWIIGSGLVLLISGLRIRAFERLVRLTSTTAQPELVAMATQLAGRLGLASLPDIRVSSARLSPLTWWTGGAVRIVLPSILVRGVPAAELRWVLAHELAHVKRRDHLVRWLEWLACVAFWWNPVVWWARRGLRIAEEVATDAHVIGRLGGPSRAYARALLSVIEALDGPSAPSPSMATGIDAADTLERRFRRIVADAPMRRAPVALVACLLTAGLSMMTIGLGPVSDSDPRVAAPPSEIPQLLTAAPETRTATRGTAVPALSGDGTALLSAEVAGAQAVLRRAAQRERSTARVGRRLLGSASAERLTGTAGRDLLLGRKGADTLSSGRGPDRIRGGGGSDTIHSGSGSDAVGSWRDGSPDSVDCGPGQRDRAVIDATDTTVRCEVVIVKDVQSQ
jgi:beta-lactamase regulating signal transducer with metallopeptidase domain